MCQLLPRRAPKAQGSLLFMLQKHLVNNRCSAVLHAPGRAPSHHNSVPAHGAAFLKTALTVHQGSSLYSLLFPSRMAEPHSMHSFPPSFRNGDRSSHGNMAAVLCSVLLSCTQQELVLEQQGPWGQMRDMIRHKVQTWSSIAILKAKTSLTKPRVRFHRNTAGEL